MSAELKNEAVLHRTDRDGIATLTLNRPAAFNSLSSELIAALQAELDSIRDDASVRVVIIAGAGPGFSAGHDLKEVRAHAGDTAFFQGLMARCSAMMMAIVHSPKPVIAEVQGTATAAGCQLVASCDLAVAADDATFATPGVNIGLFCHTPMVALARNVGRKHAMEMLLTGELMDAETAVRFGLINKAVPAARLGDETRALAAKIAAKSSYTLAIGKEAFYRQLEQDQAAAYDYASEVMIRNLMAHDAEEGIDAFIQKRPPEWQDR